MPCMSTQSIYVAARICIQNARLLRNVTTQAMRSYRTQVGSFQRHEITSGWLVHASKLRCRGCKGGCGHGRWLEELEHQHLPNETSDIIICMLSTRARAVNVMETPSYKWHTNSYVHTGTNEQPSVHLAKTGSDIRNIFSIYVRETSSRDTDHNLVFATARCKLRSSHAALFLHDHAARAITLAPTPSRRQPSTR
ncbi:hypothetical protein CBL_03183 [Carabus blaptoides fortunei]